MAILCKMLNSRCSSLKQIYATYFVALYVKEVSFGLRKKFISYNGYYCTRSCKPQTTILRTNKFVKYDRDETTILTDSRLIPAPLRGCDKTHKVNVKIQTR
jgi:hypothetical protein